MLQYNHKGRRWYYNNGLWYISVTEFVKNALPTAPHLLKWYKDNSAEFVDQTLRESAEFGTQFHNYMEILCGNGSLRAEQIHDERMQLLVAAGAQFLADYGVEPSMIEARLKHDADANYPLNFAGTVDLVAKTKNGFAIIDWKTGNIWDTHKYQMMCYLLAFKQAFPIYEDTEFQLINVRPKEWRSSKPTYEAKTWKVENNFYSADWTKLRAMMRIYEFDDPKPRKVFNGFTLGESPSWEEVAPQDYGIRALPEEPF